MNHWCRTGADRASVLRFICVQGKGEKKKGAKTKTEFLPQLFETINEPQCDIVFVLFFPAFPHPAFIISQSWQWEGPFSRPGALPR